MIISRRRNKSKFRAKVAKRISELPPEDWNRAYPNIPESYNFFKALDESNLEQFKFYYIIVYDHKIPVGAAACFLMNYALDTSIRGPFKRLANSIKRLMPNIFSLRALICGTPLGKGHLGIAGPKNAVINEIIERMERIAKKNKAIVIAFKDFDGNYEDALSPLVSKGFSKFDSLPWTELDIGFKNFDEYLKTLSGATRYDLRRKFKKVDDIVKIDLKITDKLDGNSLKCVYRLYLDIVSRHDMEFEVLSIDFFRNISKNMPKEAKYFLWSIDGKLVAFLFCLVSGDMMVDYYAGFEYSVAYKYHLYFIKFRDTINWCIENGIKKYEMGSTGYEPKRRLDFKFVPLYIYARFRNPLLRPVFNFVSRFLKFENFDPELKKLKKKKSR